MATQAKITLSVQHGIVNPPQRILILDAARPVASIGRASKSITKGLFSAPDNAWFDSPVMSRDHAQFKLKIEDKTITIEDIGSMHGTYLNGVELAHHAPSTLNNGDIVVFGAEVRRGPETFPACGFQIAVEFIEPTSSGTFAFPESSDMEGDQDDDAEDDYDFNDDDHTGRQQQSSEDGASIESQPPNAPKFDDAIDLTRDESPQESNRIDLTGETLSEQNIMEVLAGRPKDIDHRAHSVSIGIMAGNAPILLDSEDDEFDVASFNASDQPEDGASDFEGSDGSGDSSMHHEEIFPVSEGSESESEEIFPVSEESESESEDMVIADSYDVESVHGLFEEEVEDQEITHPTINPLTRYARAHDNTTILLSDIRTRTQLPESVFDDDDDDDNESEFGLSEAGEEGLRALIDGGLLREEAATSQESKDSESEPDNDTEFLVTNSAIGNVETKEQSPAPESMCSLAATAELSTSQNQNFTGLSAVLLRQPSPSDAAMVKSAAPSKQARTFLKVGEIGNFGQPTAQNLGNRSGKIAFFEAREANKAKFGAEVKLVKPALVAPFKPTNPSNFWQSDVQTISNVGTAFSNSLGNLAKATSSLGPTFPTREPCSFLDKPDQTRIPTRTASPQLDMTSAFSYNVSKNSATTTLPITVNSRGIKIDDIIEPAIPRPYRLKRKAEDISVATEEEIRVWAKAAPTSNTSKTNPEKATTKSQPATVAGITRPISVSSAMPAISEVRPTKRIKKMLENVGYAALGGVAVGAGLFTVLVATAPDFL